MIKIYHFNWFIYRYIIQYSKASFGSIVELLLPDIINIIYKIMHFYFFNLNFTRRDEN